MKKFDYDLVVIGSGAAGTTSALMASGAGLKVAIIEASSWGGTNLNRRDIPFAAALNFSQNYKNTIEATKFGLISSDLRYNYPTTMNWINTAKKRAGANSKKDLEDAGVDCISGFAQFITPNQIAVGERQISAKDFLIATGTTPKDSKIAGAKWWDSKDENDSLVRCTLPEEIFNMTKLPKVVLVVGGGATGCETAEYLSEMGSTVILAEISERLLPKEDPEAGEIIEKRLSKTCGVKVLTSTRVLSVTEAEETLPNGRRINAKKVTFIKDGKEKSVKVETVVLATGSQPATDMGLNNAKVDFDSEGIKVSNTMQTSMKNIYAAGDCANATYEKKMNVNEISSSEKSSYEAAMATANIVNHTKETVQYDGFVRMTNTYPKVAEIGLTEDECIVRDLNYKQELVPLDLIAASNTTDFHDGFVKIIINRDKKIIGATIVAPNADLMIEEIVMAKVLDLKVVDIATMPHVATGFSDSIRIAARRLARG